MYSYTWDEETGGLLLNTEEQKFSKEPRPVYSRELDILGFDRYWNYDKDDSVPIMWAEANNYIYRGRLVGQTKGGSFYVAPEIKEIAEPEPNNGLLQRIDIQTMIAKNRIKLEQLSNEAIRKIQNIYTSYQNKVDVFYVAFSGGKDSVVTLDLVMRALPHDRFIVLFGDTMMEFPETYEVVEQTKKLCESKGVRFYVAKSRFKPQYTWNQFGPPGQKLRWCCSVHKTAPQILKLREITRNVHFSGMAIMGVRADESVTRSKYKELNYGTKHQGQFDFYPILGWNSAELFLYIFQEELIQNKTYLSGNSRAGCLVCPNEASKNTWFKQQCYQHTDNPELSTSFFNDIIINTTVASQMPEKNVREFMEYGVWKSRHNGQKLRNAIVKYEDEYHNHLLQIIIHTESQDWRQWLKTIGEYHFASEDNIEIEFRSNVYKIKKSKTINSQIFSLALDTNTKDDIDFMASLKCVFQKSAYCIRCQVCQSNCPHGFIAMDMDCVEIDDRCHHCRKCHKINKNETGCLMAISMKLPKERNKMDKSIDRYKNMGVKFSWICDYFEKKDKFWQDNQLGSMMITALNTFLSDAGISQKKRITDFGQLLANIGVDSEEAWGLIACNLAYTPQFAWWIKNVNFNTLYTESHMKSLLDDEVKSGNSKNNIVSGFKNIFMTNKILGQIIGMGNLTIMTKGNNTYLVDAMRLPWKTPSLKVVLYCLYKFAEACGDYKQFTLTRLMDSDIESDGITPTQIFGLDKETLTAVLNGLSANYPEFIHVSFTLDLDNITLSDDKTSKDVLDLFK